MNFEQFFVCEGFLKKQQNGKYISTGPVTYIGRIFDELPIQFESVNGYFLNKFGSRLITLNGFPLVCTALNSPFNSFKKIDLTNYSASFMNFTSSLQLEEVIFPNSAVYDFSLCNCPKLKKLDFKTTNIYFINLQMTPIENIRLRSAIIRSIKLNFHEKMNWLELIYVDRVIIEHKISSIIEKYVGKTDKENIFNFQSELLDGGYNPNWTL